MKIELTVNGLKIQAQYQNEEIENVHKPLLHMLAALQTVNPQRRTVVFLCAPPGTGKSTLTTFWGISRATRPGTARYSDAPDGWFSPLQ